MFNLDAIEAQIEHNLRVLNPVQPVGPFWEVFNPHTGVNYAQCATEARAKWLSNLFDGSDYSLTGDRWVN